ncbi:hypothetical protein PAPHI01_2225 [Pancytospora philotis]|nr:hypothetical protein PAPHI01_2225 [Pancytospora philotis]
MAQYFLVKGHHSIARLVEIAGKAHIETAAGTLKVRESMHSNAFLVGPECAPVVQIYEACPVDYDLVLQAMPVSRLAAPVYQDLSRFLSQREVAELAAAHRLLPSGGASGCSMARIANADIAKLLCYMQTLDGPADFAMHNEQIKSWALGNFKGTSAEIGYYTLLEHLDRSTPAEFVREWQRVDLYDARVAELREYISRACPSVALKDRMLAFLADV